MRGVVGRALGGDVGAALALDLADLALACLRRRRGDVLDCGATVDALGAVRVDVAVDLGGELASSTPSSRSTCCMTTSSSSRETTPRVISTSGSARLSSSSSSMRSLIYRTSRVWSGGMLGWAWSWRLSWLMSSRCLWSESKKYSKKLIGSPHAYREAREKPITYGLQARTSRGVWTAPSSSAPSPGINASFAALWCDGSEYLKSSNPLFCWGVVWRHGIGGRMTWATGRANLSMRCCEGLLWKRRDEKDIG